jgi:hypothetical protein
LSGDEILAEATDRRGRRVVLLKRIWHEKVLVDHAEMAKFLGEVLIAVSRPTHVEADPAKRRRVRCFAHGVGASRWLQVVVSYEQEPARIISAFATRKDPPTWSE